MNKKNFQAEITILGGGVAGLWLLNRLKAKGYNAILLESDALASGQSIVSQGIIHGGVKYALNGLKNASSESISEMPKRWQACLAGEGEIDLSHTTILSPNQILWTQPSLLSKITGFFASKTLRARMKKIKPTDFPKALHNKKCQAYELDEPVLQVTSLIKNLQEKVSDPIYQSEAIKEITQDEKVHLHFQDYTLSTDKLILTAGQGNQALSTLCGINTPAMQTRPLHMAYVKHPAITPLYAHCLGKSKVPFLTITSPEPNTWYLGGEIAESGVQRNKAQQKQKVIETLTGLFPEINWEEAKIGTFLINRAEEKNKLGLRPSLPSVSQHHNILLAWPTKLAFAPLLADAVMQKMDAPQNHSQTLLPLSKPAIAKAPWE